MSYSLDILFFNEPVSKDECIEKADNFCKEMLEQSFKEEIQASIPWIPSVRDGRLDTKTVNDPDFSLNETDKYFIQLLFRYKFVYWEKYKLLGVIHIPVKTGPASNFSHIYFQNSCDTDYEYETWDCLKDPCRQELTDIIDAVKNDDSNKYGEDEYQKKSYLYDKMTELLDIQKILWEDCDKYDSVEIFNLCRTPTIQHQLAINMYAAKAIAAYINNIYGAIPSTNNSSESE